LCLLILGIPALSQLPAPQAVEAAAFGPDEIRVYWNPVPGAVSYTVLRDGAVVASAQRDATQWSDKPVQPGRNYSYQVRANGPEGPGAVSEPYIERTDAPLPARLECELLVVGATTAGVAAAVVSARYGINVVLIEETRRLGGMSVNGLGASDIRRADHASGFFEEFRTGVARLYGSGNGLRYEPRVAHQVMKSLIWAAPGLTVFRQTRPTSVRTRNGRIEWVDVECIAPEAPAKGRICPRLVIDATECGDVAAWAGAPYRVGREARSKREPHAGHIYYSRLEDRALPGSTGRADRRIQAYSYLMTVKDYGPGADRTIPRPAGYDEARYRHAPPWPRSWNATSGKLPNDKYEINQHPYGSDLQGINYGYPEASYAERRRMESRFRDHALGYLYWIQTGEGRKHIGLSEDDFRAEGGWPSLLYIREARRFEADVVMDESDIMDARKLVRPDAIGIGDYAMDSHATQPKEDPTTADMGEGEFYLPQYTPWHQVPFRIMIPRRVDNLFIATAVSATHVAYGTYRMEPVRMHFGSAAAIGAALCLRHGLLPREVPANQVQSELLKQEAGSAMRPARDGIGAPGPSAHPALLYMFSDVTPSTPGYRAIQWLGARGFYPCPPPAQRTPAQMLASEPFRPDEPLTAGEAMRLLLLLGQRARASGDAFSVPDLPGTPERMLTRGDAAVALAEAFGWKPRQTASRYTDLRDDTEVRRAADALMERGIDVQVWGVTASRNRAGELEFAADRAITRRQFAQWLYLAHRFIGPLFFDHPMDRQPAIPVRLPSPDATQR
jgi:hypothetical protein